MIIPSEDFLYEQRRRTGDSQNDLAAGFYVLCNGNGTPSGAYLAPVLPWHTTSHFWAESLIPTLKSSALGGTGNGIAPGVVGTSNLCLHIPQRNP